MILFIVAIFHGFLPIGASKISLYSYIFVMFFMELKTGAESLPGYPLNGYNPKRQYMKGDINGV